MLRSFVTGVTGAPAVRVRAVRYPACAVTRLDERTVADAMPHATHSSRYFITITVRGMAVTHGTHIPERHESNAGNTSNSTGPLAVPTTVLIAARLSAP